MVKKKIKIENKQETEIIKLSPEKWARRYKIDPALVQWWTNKGILISEEEFVKIKNKVFKEE